MSDKTSLDVPLYTGGALQISVTGVNRCKDRESSAKVMAATIKRIGGYVDAHVNFVKFHQGTDVRLTVLPEYIFSGFPIHEGHDEWMEKACIRYDGPEYQALGDIAQRNNLFLAGNVYEIDPNFPEIYFQTCFIIGPSGDVIHRYRRLTSALDSTPHDVLDKYLDIYGLDGVFPVTRTEIGNLATVASEEIMWPELTRIHALRGAELILHPTSEPGSLKMTDREACRRARAFENAVYVISANTASIDDIPIPAYTCSMMSKVVDYNSNILAEAAPGGESMLAHAVIDIRGLRSKRRRVGMSNLLARQPTDLYAMAYAEANIHPANSLLQDGKVKPPADRVAFYRERQEKILERMTNAGII